MGGEEKGTGGRRKKKGTIRNFLKKINPKSVRKIGGEGRKRHNTKIIFKKIYIQNDVILN